MTSFELNQLVAQIGDEILARVAPHLLAERAAAAPSSIARYFDHTLLKPEATGEEIIRLAAEARRYGFASVCINPYWVSLAARELSGTPVKVCTVIGFPLGASLTQSKRQETEAVIRLGAREVDMVLNAGALVAGDYDAVKLDIQAVVEVAHGAGAIVKVILETCLLDDKQKMIACALAGLAGADFVKTSTGFNRRGAAAHDVALMRSVVGEQMGVKASGGIRTLEDFRAMLAAGANRIGASASVQIVEAAGQ